ncbi:MAG: hypothetical protein IKZ01_01175 [Anaerotignum sp.]|nr:hypothetical protein [Anaerotignum sp.]MBR5122684.1 hypothetical protein [Anaerotignum sp.]
MSNRAKVSGHSGLPEEVELRMMQEKAEERRREKDKLFSEMLEVMNRNGVAPNERMRHLARFVKWLEGKK